jgi:hypothetical protein
MSDKPRIGDVGTEIIIDMGVDITGATGLDFAIYKPSWPATGGLVNWTPTVYNSNYLRYIVVTGDFDEEGDYEVVPALTLGGWSGHGDPAYFRVFGIRED